MSHVIVDFSLIRLLIVCLCRCVNLGRFQVYTFLWLGGSSDRVERAVIMLKSMRLSVASFAAFLGPISLPTVQIVGLTGCSRQPYSVIFPPTPLFRTKISPFRFCTAAICTDYETRTIECRIVRLA